jgi:GTP-binding protein
LGTAEEQHLTDIATNQGLRNIAIIAHVDHGKTTLVDQLFRRSGLFREGQVVEERLMDRMDLERERGITIAAKNCSVLWGKTRLNILDTPGHADFGGEVERALKMVEGALLLVDASEGPLPQTRFVLRKALEAGLKLVVVINKIDRQDARPKEVLNEIYDLFIDLDADENQIDFPILYSIGRQGIVRTALDAPDQDMALLLDTICREIPPPSHSPSEPFQMLVADLDYNDYLGRLAIGKVINGRVSRNMPLVCLGAEKRTILRATKLQVYQGLKLQEVEAVEAGDIAILAGVEDVHIGDTICTSDAPKALKRISVDEPTVAMRFTINDSPLSGKEGRFVQSTKLRDRLFQEAVRNVSIQVEQGDDADVFIVKGRGELQMAILIETLRREGYELTVGRPQVILKREGNQTLEPIEHLYVDVDEPFVGVVTEKLAQRKGRMLNLVNHGLGRVRMEFSIPSRSLIGFRNEFLTDTKGTGILNAYLAGYEPHRGEFPTRMTGSLVSDRAGVAVAYALYNLEPRGCLFSLPGQPVYEGMIVGEHNRDNDLDVNPAKEKKLTNMRASGRDEAVVLTPLVPMTLERALEFIKDDEMVEVTPKSIRLRKEHLPQSLRNQMRAKNR